MPARDVSFASGEIGRGGNGEGGEEANKEEDGNSNGGKRAGHCHWAGRVGKVGLDPGVTLTESKAFYTTAGNLTQSSARHSLQMKSRELREVRWKKIIIGAQYVVGMYSNLDVSAREVPICNYETSHMFRFVFIFFLPFIPVSPRPTKAHLEWRASSARSGDRRDQLLTQWTWRWGGIHIFHWLCTEYRTLSGRGKG
jgi:hypothetical protein